MILFIVSEAGPAKYLAHIMSLLDQSDFDCIASDISAIVLDDFSIEYVIGDEGIIVSNYHLIITGGSFLGPCIDQKWVGIGLQNNIKTITIF